MFKKFFERIYFLNIMVWLIFAFSGPVLWAISFHLDKYLVDRYFKDSHVATLMIFTALVGLLMLPFILFYHPEVFKLGWQSASVIILSGVLYMGAMIFYLQALQSEEASVVAPFFQAAPLFGFALAYLVLGEVLTGAQLWGGSLIIAGTVLLSLRFGRDKAKIKPRLVLLMLACALLLALSSVIFKFFAVQDEFWVTTFWTYAGEALFGFVLLAIPKYHKDFFSMLRSNTAAVLGVNGANELINLGGGLGTRFALLLAPLSLVQAIGSTTTLFVFVFGVLLTLLFPRLGKEDLSAKSLIQKALSAILIVGGVLLINR
jgi:drug/metabolite transporter (DMT)-like permease